MTIIEIGMSMIILRKLVSNPYLNLLVAVVLLYSGLSESWHEIQEIEEFRFGVHHGIIIYSLLQILKTLPEVFEGMEYLTEVGEQE